MTAEQIITGLPARFIPGKAHGISAIVHLDISGEGGGLFTLQIHDGTCTLKTGLHGEATSVLRTTAKAYCEIETGKLNAKWAIISGKLKVVNLQEITRVIDCFERL